MAKRWTDKDIDALKRLAKQRRLRSRPPQRKGATMIKRRRFKQTQSLEERLAAEAMRLRDEARLLHLALPREQLLRKARQSETASHMNDWLTSPGLRPPR
jgi:hypothetical protein